MHWQDSLDAGRDIVQRLLGKSPLRFVQAIMHEIPEQSGIYLWSDTNSPEKFYYFGRSQTGLRTRMQRHWNQDDGGMLTKLKNERRAPGKTEQRLKEESQNWIRENVVLHWLTEDDIGMDLKFAESFAIGVLQPEYNRQ